MIESVVCRPVDLRAPSVEADQLSQLIADTVWHSASTESLRKKWEGFDSRGYALYFSDSCLVAAGVLIADELLVFRGGEHYWVIDSLAVAPERQSQGYGSILLAHIEAAARTEGVKGLLLQSRRQARRFWANHGYSQMGRFAFIKILDRDGPA